MEEETRSGGRNQLNDFIYVLITYIGLCGRRGTQWAGSARRSLTTKTDSPERTHHICGQVDVPHDGTIMMHQKNRHANYQQRASRIARHGQKLCPGYASRVPGEAALKHRHQSAGSARRSVEAKKERKADKYDCDGGLADPD